MRQDVAMSTILCQGVRETRRPIYIVKTTVLKMSCMNGFLKKEKSKLQIECMGIGKTFERGMTITICSFQGTNWCCLVNAYPVFYLYACLFFPLMSTVRLLRFLPPWNICRLLHSFSFGIYWVPPNPMPMHFCAYSVSELHKWCFDSNKLSTNKYSQQTILQLCA